MRKDRKVSLSLVAMAITTGIAVIGTTAGSLAWYAYNRNVSFSFIGTTVSKSLLLNVGLVDDDNWISSDSERDYNLTRVNNDDHSIVFATGSSGFPVEVIREYLFNSNTYAVDKLFPVTSQKRALAAQGNLDLYKSPDYGDTTIKNIPASQSDYVKLPFAFRAEGENHENIEDLDIWLTDATVQASGENIDQAVRVYVDSDQRDFLLKPADANAQTGSTKVGGLLDLDGDGTYDYDKSGGTEYYYGEADGTVTFDDTIYGIPFENAPFVNVNGVSLPSDPSTFYGKHNYYAKIANNLNSVNAEVAEYQTFGTVKPLVRPNGDYYRDAEHDLGIPIANTGTNADNYGIGYSTMTIFIEGWDHTVIDKAVGYSFNLGLRFEINRI